MIASASQVLAFWREAGEDLTPLCSVAHRVSGSVLAVRLRLVRRDVAVRGRAHAGHVVVALHRGQRAVLAEAGAHLYDVVKTTVYLKDMDDFAAMNEVYGRYLAPTGVVPPARSTVEVSRLPKGALVEIEVIARL